MLLQRMRGLPLASWRNRSALTRVLPFKRISQLRIGCLSHLLVENLPKMLLNGFVGHCAARFGRRSTLVARSLSWPSWPSRYPLQNPQGNGTTEQRENWFKNGLSASISRSCPFTRGRGRKATKITGLDGVHQLKIIITTTSTVRLTIGGGLEGPVHSLGGRSWRNHPVR
jgi:hypothetical protein